MLVANSRGIFPYPLETSNQKHDVDVEFRPVSRCLIGDPMSSESGLTPILGHVMNPLNELVRKNKVAEISNAILPGESFFTDKINNS